jgi:N-acetylmuramoyl-L-alanine amidase
MAEFTIRNHLLYRDGKQVPFRATPNRGGIIVPEVLVEHDTAGRIDGNSSVEWLCDPQAKASAHLVMARDAEASITQLVPFNAAAWHAGPSSYKGRQNVNAFSIGIEIVNPGSMTELNGRAKPWWDQTFDKAQYGIVRRATKEHGDALWMPYTASQIEISKQLGRALVRHYALKDVTTHWAISPGRKVDTNPLFPLDEVRSFALGGGLAAAGTTIAAPTAVPPRTASRIGTVTADKLNFRRTANGEITGSLPRGTLIEINFFEREWINVTTPAGYSGFVHSNFVTIVN